MGGMHLTTTLSDVSQHCSRADMHQRDRALELRSLHWETLHRYRIAQCSASDTAYTASDITASMICARAAGKDSCQVMLCFDWYTLASS